MFTRLSGSSLLSSGALIIRYEARHARQLNYMFAAGCLLLSTLGLFVAGVIPTESTIKHGANPRVGWSLMVVCLGAAAVFTRRANDKTIQVRADSNGLYSRPHSRATIPWNAISGVKVVGANNRLILRVKLHDPDIYPQTRHNLSVGALNISRAYGDFGIIALYYDRGIWELNDAVMHHRPDLYDWF